MANGYTLDAFAVGDPVWVHAMGSWYEGRISTIGRTNVRVFYISGAGAQRIKSVNPANTYRGQLLPGATRGSGQRFEGPGVLLPDDYRAILKGRPLRPEETGPACECGAPRDPYTGRLGCVR